MARIFTSGFEECTQTTDFALVGFNSISGSPVTTNAVAHGPTGASRSLKISSSVANYVPMVAAVSRASGTYWARVYVYFDAFGAATTSVSFLGYETELGSGGGASVRLTPAGANAGRLTLRNTLAGAPSDLLSNTVLNLNTWYRLEFKLVISKTAGSCELKIFANNAVNPLETLTNNNDVDTLGAGAGITNIKLGLRAAGDLTGTGFLYMDDFCLNDESGTTQNGYPGPGVVELLTPNSDDSVSWTRGGSTPAATNWQGVNDVAGGGTPDDAVAFNTDSGVVNSDTLGLSQLSAGAFNQTLVLMDVMCRYKGVTSPCTFNLFAVDTINGNTLYTGPSVTTSTSATKFTSTSEHLVVDLTGKNGTAVNAMQVGYQGLSGSQPKQITAVWARVEFVPKQGDVFLNPGRPNPADVKLLDPTFLSMLSDVTAPSTASGVLLPIVAISGTSDGVAADSTTLTGSGALAASAAGVADSTPTLVGTGALLGSSTGAASSTAAVSGSGALLGSSSGAASSTVSLIGAGALAATSSGVAGSASTLGAFAAIAATSAGVASGTSALTASGALLGSAAGTATAVSTALGSGALAASSAGVAASTASLLASGALVATSAGVASNSVTLTASGALAATSAGAAANTVTLVGAGALIGSSTGTSTAVLAPNGSLSATVAGVASSTATLVGSGTLAATTSGAASTSSTLTASGLLTASTLGLASAAAVLLGDAALIANAFGTSSCSGTLLVAGPTVVFSSTLAVLNPTVALQLANSTLALSTTNSLVGSIEVI